MIKDKVKKALTVVIPGPAIALARSGRGNLRRKRYFRDLQKLQPVKISSNPYSANMLVVNNSSYVNVSRVCALSFLKFNPESHVKIHVDEETRPLAEKVYSKEIARRKVTLVKVNPVVEPWQRRKVDLICSMSEDLEFYMDADLRWNGPLNLSHELTFFVREFLIGDNESYAKAFRTLGLSWINDSKMKNTSFFYWGNQVDQNPLKERVQKIYATILDALNRSSLEEKLKTDLTRLSEQIAMSAALEETETMLVFLKAKDGQMDGSFLESSYYGATGTSF
jgi:hypothetical protein